MAAGKTAYPADFSPYNEIPMYALRMASRKCLSKYLNLPADLPTDSGHLPDFTGLAEIIGFEYLEIRNFQLRPDPTGAVLEECTTRSFHDFKPTVGNLCEVIKQLGRFDVLTSVWKMIEKDLQNWQERQARFAESVPVQDETISQSSRPETDHDVDQFQYMTTADVANKTPQSFDAFICHSVEDVPFVKEMVSYLEGSKHKLKLCIPERDMLPGGSYYTISAKLIEERCKKMVAIVSPNFLKSPQCDFQIKFAHAISPGSRSKKVIPILKEPCLLPSILKHITLCDYTKADLKEWFWDRLARAIQMPTQTHLASQEQQQLSEIKFMLDLSSSNWHSSSTSSSSPSTSSSSCAQASSSSV